MVWGVVARVSVVRNTSIIAIMGTFVRISSLSRGGVIWSVRRMITVGVGISGWCVSCVEVFVLRFNSFGSTIVILGKRVTIFSCNLLSFSAIGGPLSGCHIRL